MFYFILISILFIIFKIDKEHNNNKLNHKIVLFKFNFNAKLFYLKSLGKYVEEENNFGVRFVCKISNLIDDKTR